ncbi:MAG: NUDIX domain-containing protein [Actinomycetota bacterium]
MSRDPIPSWYFALVVVRWGKRFLLVQERKHGSTWCLPGGRVEPGETLVQAARREIQAETGIRILLEGILRIEHTPMSIGTARVRVIFVGRPQDQSPPKSEPDEETLAACWFSLEEFDQLALRGKEIREICKYVANGAPLYPLSLITFEGVPFGV